MSVRRLPIGQLAEASSTLFGIDLQIAHYISYRMTHRYKIISVIKFDGNLKDNSDFTRASKRGKIQVLLDLPNECLSSAVPKEPTVHYCVGSIHYEHVWCIAKMEGIVNSYSGRYCVSLHFIVCAV